jgi:PKHD-type hydroxylase
MLLHIPAVIDRAQLGVIVSALAESEFIDGKLSAGAAASQVKHNEELNPQAPTIEYLNKILIGNLYNNATFRSAALPHRVSTPFFARYRRGMSYGDHIDDPVMGGGQRYRSDVSITVFLNEPGEYAGGELVIRTAFGDRQVKLAAGDAVVYPSSSLHHVAAVTDGERLVAVAWAQSLVRDPAKRELLYELDQARSVLLRDAPGTEVAAQVDHSYVNLIRMWSEV